LLGVEDLSDVYKYIVVGRCGRKKSNLGKRPELLNMQTDRIGHR